MSGCQIARLPDCQPFPQDSSVSFQSSVSSPQLAPAGPRLPSLVGARPVTGASAWAPPSLLCSELSEGERGAAIGLQLVNASSFSCLAPHRHALYQTGTVSGDLYRNAGTSNTAASLEYSTSMPMLKILLPPEWLDYENAAARLFCRGQTPRCERPALHAWSGQRSNGCCGQHGRCKFGAVMRPEFESQTVQKIENPTAVDKDGCRCRCRCRYSCSKVGE